MENEASIDHFLQYGVDELSTSKLPGPLIKMPISGLIPDPVIQKLGQCCWGICSSRTYFRCLFVLESVTTTAEGKYFLGLWHNLTFSLIQEEKDLLGSRLDIDGQEFDASE